jgi:hypothetical protein
MSIVTYHTWVHHATGVGYWECSGCQFVTTKAFLSETCLRQDHSHRVIVVGEAYLCAICDAFLGGVTGPEKIEDLQGAVIAFPSEAEPGHLYVHSDHYNKLYELDHRDGAWIIEEVNADGSAIPGKSSGAWLETKGEPISDMDTLRQRGH